MNLDDLILLQDAPAQRGEQLGLNQKMLLKHRCDEFKALCSLKQIDPLELPNRARQITTSMNVLVPEWVLEARAAATVAQVPAATMMAITSPPERIQPLLLPKRANDSTAFVASTTDSSARTILLENCDGPEIPHYAISRGSSPGTLAYVALAEAGDLGIKAFVNESGLAGTFHIGPQVEDTTNAIPPSLVLRQIAERATNCAQAALEFESLQKRIGTGTPDRRGIIYLFADSSGELLLLEATATRCMHRRKADGHVIITNRMQLGTTSQSSIEANRHRCLREFLGNGPVNLRRTMNAACLDQKIGEEKGVCDTKTRASFIAVLGQGQIPGFALVTIGSPLCSLPFPLFPGTGVPRWLLDGSPFMTKLNANNSRIRNEMDTRTEPPAAPTIPADKRSAYADILMKKLEAIQSPHDPIAIAEMMREVAVLNRQFSELAPVPVKEP